MSEAQNRSRGHRLRAAVAGLAAVAVLAATFSAVDLVAPGGDETASAVSGAGFDPGYIISDAEFYDGYAMTVAQVQAFLDARVPACNGGPLGCLKDYRQSTVNIAADRYCDGYRGGASESAATIIVNVARSCGINPKAILVLLEKEQGLVTSRAPSRWAYQAATGMSCPDTAPCDPSVAGFFYQVFYGVRQYQVYRAFPASFNHRAGQVNQVRYHPNASCGTRSLFIQNDATAGLYNYTPYTPNTAALANMYGTGDACSSYGNRNFWRLYSDWFGSPTAGGTLLTFSGTNKIFLLIGSTKYEILDPNVAASFSALGPVKTASVQFLRSFETRGVISRPVVRDADGRIGLVDGSVFRPMSTCAVVAEYGEDCAGPLPQLTAFQSLALSSGPILRTYLQTATGQRFVMRDGVRREVLDNESLAEAGIAGTFIPVGARAIAALPLGEPIVRPGSVFTSGDNIVRLYADGAVREVGDFTARQLGLAARSRGTLASASIALLPRSEERFDGVVTGADGVSVLLGGERVGWADSAVPLPQRPVAVPDWFLSAIPRTAEVAIGSVVRAPGSSVAYSVDAAVIRSMGSLSTSALPSAVDLPTIIVRGLPKGTDFVPDGTLVRTASSPSVFVIDGQRRVRVLSMAVPRGIGFGPIATVSDAVLSGYATRNGSLSWAVTCGGQPAIGIAGQLRPLSPERVTRYGLPRTALTDATCAGLTTGGPMTDFIRVDGRSIFKVEAGTLRQVMSLSRWSQIRGNQTFVDVPAAFANQFTVGPPA